MLKPLIRTLNGWRFELPLALVLGAAVAFATIAMPHHLFGRLPGVAASGHERPIQIAFAVLAALIAAFAAYRAMTHSWQVAAPIVAEEEEDDGLPPIDVAVRLRRSDAHPDFPPREPIRASRDLGEPFMDIVGFADGPNAAGAAPKAEPVATVPIHPAEPGPVLEDMPVAEAPDPSAQEPVETPDPVAETAKIVDAPEREEGFARVRSADEDASGVPEWPLPATPLVAPPSDAVAEQPEDQGQEQTGGHDPITAFTPEPEIAPAPRPERAKRESLAEMMERLSAGLQRRAGKPVAPPPVDMLADVLNRPRAATPELREALDELNRLAQRRG
jgi:hypothetical protein